MRIYSNLVAVSGMRYHIIAIIKNYISITKIL